MSILNRSLLGGRLSARTVSAVLYDVVVALVVWAGGVALRYEFADSAELRPLLLGTTPLVLAVQLACFAYCGLYRGFWRYASLHDVKQIAKAVGLAALLVPTALVLARHAQGVPRTLFVVGPLLQLLLMAAGRIGYRWWKEHRPDGVLQWEGQPLLILGAGERALMLLESLARSPSWRSVGLLDDDDAKVGRNLAGTPVLGTWAELAEIAERTGAKHAILAVNAEDHGVRRRAFQLCEQAHVKLLVAPELDDVMSGRVQVSRVRQVELDDLLGRDPVRLDEQGLRHWIEGRTVMVTGAGGSIGSELCRQIARFGPGRLVLFDHDEYAMYRISEQFREERPGTPVVTVIGDVKDADRLRVAFGRHRPVIVFHAAAYKHVPLMETDNASQAVANNCVGSLRVAEACLAWDVDRLVFVSTDKAVNPTNVMGATKRLAEMLLQHLAARERLPVVMVRFGNVLGSTGSVVPKFHEQIARGGPVTVTHPDMQRYFMSVQEAAQLVLQAGLIGRPGEVFVLDMGEPVRIADLARDMIRLSGASEDIVKIVFTGLRPGEKLFEELLADDETTLSTPHPKLRIQRPVAPPGPGWNRLVRLWLDGARQGEDDAIREGLQRFVPEYRPARVEGAAEPTEDAPVGAAGSPRSHG
jgi:FlaA1/EpsC-like NDP-sugar epimerase